MADENSSEFPSLKTAYLTIVDIFGALVPGLVWVTLLGDYLLDAGVNRQCGNSSTNADDGL